MLKSKKISRRNFIKVASTTGVALAIGGIKAPYVFGQATKKPIKVGAPIPFTGRYSRQAEYSIQGYKLWAKHVNEMGHSYGNEHLPDKKPGLIDGRPIELILLDDASDPTTGARLMMQLIYGEKVDLLLGAYSSSITMATRPIIESAQIPTACPMGSSQEIFEGQNLKWMVQIMSPAREKAAGVEVLCKKAGYKKVAIVYIDDAMPIAVAKGLRKRLEKEGLNVVFFEAYPIGIRDMVPTVRKIRDGGAEVLVCCGYTEDDILITKAALSLNWTPRAFWHTSDFAYPDFKNVFGMNAAWHCGDTEWLPEADWPGSKELVKAYKKEYQRDMEWVVAGNYGSCQILEEAVKRVGSVDDKKAIRDIMFGMERDTVFAHYKVKPLGDPDAGLQIGATRLSVQYQVEKGELALRVIYPPKVATKEFIHPFRWQKL